MAATPEEVRAQAPRGQGGIFQALHNPQFRLVWASSWCFYVGRMMELAVLLWLVLDLTGSPSRVALVGVFRTAPMFLLGLAAGTLADKFARKYLLLAAQTLNAGTALTMTVLLATGELAFWYAYVAIFITGCAWATDFSSRRALLSDVFSGPRLVNAMSLDSAVLTGSNMMGPLLGGSMIYLGGFVGAYALLAALYTTGMVIILFVRIPTQQRASALQEAAPTQREVLRSIRSNPTVLSVLLITMALNLFGFPFQQMLPIIARNVLGTGPVLYGLLGSAVGVGAITGSLFIATGQFRRHGTLFSLGASLMLAALFAFSFSKVYLLSVLLLMVAGMGMSGFSILQPVIVLQAVPMRMRGRAMGAIALCIGFSPVGIYLVGHMAEAWGPQRALTVLTATGFFVLTVLRWRFPNLRDKAAGSPEPIRTSGASSSDPMTSSGPESKPS